MKAGWTVMVMLKIVFTGPEQFDGNTGLFGNGCGLSHVVVGEAAAKTSSGTAKVNDDVGFRNSQKLRNERAAIGRRLARRPKLEFAVVEMSEAVFRFHRCVCEEGIGVSSFNNLGGGLQTCGEVAILAQSHGRRLFG